MFLVWRILLDRLVIRYVPDSDSLIIQIATPHKNEFPRSDLTAAQLGLPYQTSYQKM